MGVPNRMGGAGEGEVGEQGGVGAFRTLSAFIVIEENLMHAKI